VTAAADTMPIMSPRIIGRPPSLFGRIYPKLSGKKTADAKD